MSDRVLPPRLALVLTNCTPAEAPALAEQLVRERFAACVNVIPGVQSYYVWEGEFVVDEENTLLIKTAADVVDALVARLRELHSYSNPEIVVLDPVQVAPAYLAWACEQTGDRAR